ncbi:MAG: nicotinamide-nucleotide amidohydrolase family protein [Actinophytocola sp.]|nr:nicotinamide-nucleotide amidohydrolase family protein [Actinophytocola sp.]
MSAAADVDVADLLDVLRRAGQTVATAESITGGGVCAALTDVAGSSDVVRGGLIVYAGELKTSLAGVPQELLAERGTVDPDVTLALADGARTRCGADWGIGLTGVAGPGASGGIAAGTVYVAVAGPTSRETGSLVLPGDRGAVRAAAITAALRLLGEHLTPIVR